MLSILGFIIVFVSVIGGFMLEKGNPLILFIPAEFLIIFGSAFGAFLISSPPSVASNVIKSIGKIFSGKENKKSDYLQLLNLLFQLFSKIRKEGLISIESDIENPKNSTIFRNFPSILSNHHLITFICDNLKVIVSTNVPAYELEGLIELELETHHHHSMIPSHSVAKIADALPGLGIVAAVLGVVLTMSKIDQPPSVLGHSIGAALCGTFMGVLACYGFVGPMATNLEHRANDESVMFHVIKVALVSFVGGSAPQMAVEFGRRVIPDNEKPSFEELENTVRGK